MGNIIPFPNLRKRLLEKGLEALKEEKYQDALYFLTEAQKLGTKESEVELSIILCLFEMGEWEEAKQRCQHLLWKKQEVTDIELLQLYLSILIHLEQYAEADEMLETALQDKKLHPHEREQLLQLLRFSRKMRSSFSASSNEEIEQLLQSKRIEDQLKAIQRLENEHIVPLLPMLKQYLANEDNHPMAKTMLLRLLTAKKVSEELVIHKFGKIMTIIPEQLNEAIETQFATDILQKLERTLGSDSPSLYETASHIWMRYIYTLYPFAPLPVSEETWIAALHLSACRLQGIEMTITEIAERYHVCEQEVTQLCEKLYEIEEISFI
ncbi:tetratricopeptide repeat protein [Anoxybacillus rupiensis]|jgi:tetratricopeptide (TPR) repeat protein|uniref:Tetratricopeptide repeat protein n=1 Tax=Anoxybacteroides rupiense TaxID=311460 RepID=A0ABT5W0J6_9BACL|nr:MULTISPECIES: hypothetical protein [Anoxybacillus]KXG11510.1 hypothetical protein AT864_00593 [Anoxybacillus sp. P3H1B]MBB3907161.1 tetratricopeptide (TPR) repeat protein [Anoxybacillus rupiensis]MBS2771621.1 tetratricopeptide repeat protein [Anoxybacillus rupiensis]MDE8562845.1 tetratricopeptide repeat protein [Anoxybacillus rupiensis]